MTRIQFVAPARLVMEQVNALLQDDVPARNAVAAAFSAVDTGGNESFEVDVIHSLDLRRITVGVYVTDALVTIPQTDPALLVDVPTGVSVDGPGLRRLAQETA